MQLMLKFAFPGDVRDQLRCAQFVLGGVTAAAWSLQVWRWWRRRCQRVDRFPAVPGLPFFGQRPSLGFQMFEKWAREFGSEGVFEVNMAGERVICVCKVEPMQEVLAFRPFKVTKPVVFGNVGLLPQGNLGIYFSEGHVWSRQRRLIAPAFSPKAVQSYLPNICCIVDTMVDKLGEAASAGETINVSKLFQLMSINVIMKVAFGADWGALAGYNDDTRWLDDIMDGFWMRTLSPVPYWRLPGLPRLLGDISAPSLESLKKTLAKLLDQPRHDHTLLAKMMQQVDGAALNREEIIINLVTLFLAGSDSTSQSLAWAMYHLACHPSVQEEVVAEARELLADEGSVEVVERLALTRAVWLETQRINSVAPLQPLESAVPIMLAGRKVPARSMIFLLPRVASELSPVVRERLGGDWGTFRPSRWVQADGTLVQGPPFDGLAFGGGSRMCVGATLASTVMTLAIAKLMCAFRIDKWEGPPMQEKTSFAMRSAQDICLRFVPRMY